MRLRRPREPRMVRRERRELALLIGTALLGVVAAVLAVAGGMLAR